MLKHIFCLSRSMNMAPETSPHIFDWWWLTLGQKSPYGNGPFRLCHWKQARFHSSSNENIRVPKITCLSSCVERKNYEYGMLVGRGRVLEKRQENVMYYVMLDYVTVLCLAVVQPECRAARMLNCNLEDQSQICPFKPISHESTGSLAKL